LESQGKGELIDGDLQRWALNCDEYISMGKIDDDALVRWVKWEDLCSGPVTVFQYSFLKAYTLAKYLGWKEEQQLEMENVCQRILNFGKVLAGPRDDLLAPLIAHILRPGIRFWGLSSQLSEDAVKSEITSVPVSRAALRGELNHRYFHF